MNVRKSIRRQLIFTSLLVLAAMRPVQAQQDWKATVAGQSADKSKQAVAFLPNEIWIHAGDSITWTFASGDIHTVTFLTVGQVYPFDDTQGCPPITPSGSKFGLGNSAHAAEALGRTISARVSSATPFSSE